MVYPTAFTTMARSTKVLGLSGDNTVIFLDFEIFLMIVRIFQKNDFLIFGVFFKVFNVFENQWGSIGEPIRGAKWCLEPPNLRKGGLPGVRRAK